MAQTTGLQFADDAIQPVISNSGGVYARQRPPSCRPPSLTKLSTTSKDPENDLAKDGVVDDRDIKQKQVCHASHLLTFGLLTDSRYSRAGT